MLWKIAALVTWDHSKKISVLESICWTVRSNLFLGILKKVILKNFLKLTWQNSTENSYTKRDTQAQLFSCEYCEVFQYAYLAEVLQATASQPFRFH